MARHLRQLTTKDGVKRYELTVDGTQYAVIAPLKGKRHVLWTSFGGVPTGVIFKTLNAAVSAALDLDRRRPEVGSTGEQAEAQARIREAWKDDLE